MAKVLILLANGFEEIEALAVTDVLRRAEIETVLAGLCEGYTASASNICIIPDTTIDRVNASEFSMILLPGGQPGSDNLKADSRVGRLLRQFNNAEKLIGSIGSATTVLAAADLIAGKRVTCNHSCKDKLNGGIYEDKAVVTDGNIITSQGPGTAISFALAIVARLCDNHKAASVSSAMLIRDVTREHRIWDDRLFNSTIQALVGALEMKDSFIQGHARRVTEYALSIGSKLNLPEAEMRDLYLGSILHDIGKIGTEEKVLNKPESLNLREESLIREHPLKGTLFIAGIENLNQILPTILHHHERWDGNGYPGRLKGEEIPLHARIVSIADAFDAMMSNRSYRDGIDQQSALSELLALKGTQFDPLIVDVFIECINDSPFEMKDFSYYF